MQHGWVSVSGRWAPPLQSAGWVGGEVLPLRTGMAAPCLMGVARIDVKRVCSHSSKIVFKWFELKNGGERPLSLGALPRHMAHHL